MKIKSTEAELIQDAVRTQLEGLGKQRKSKKGDDVLSTLLGNDQVDLGVGKAISSELDPLLMAEERRAKLEKLKAMVQSGQYVIDRDAVAKSLAEDAFWNKVAPISLFDVADDSEKADS